MNPWVWISWRTNLLQDWGSRRETLVFTTFYLTEKKKSSCLARGESVLFGAKRSHYILIIFWVNPHFCFFSVPSLKHQISQFDDWFHTVHCFLVFWWISSEVAVLSRTALNVKPDLVFNAIHKNIFRLRPFVLARCWRRLRKWKHTLVLVRPWHRKETSPRWLVNYAGMPTQPMESQGTEPEREGQA